MTTLPPPRSGLLRVLLGPPVCITAIKAALLVGTALNIINQGEDIMNGAMPDWPRLALNYLVPFLVSAWSGARVMRG